MVVILFGLDFFGARFGCFGVLTGCSFVGDDVSLLSVFEVFRDRLAGIFSSVSCVEFATKLVKNSSEVGAPGL